MKNGWYAQAFAVLVYIGVLVGSGLPSLEAQAVNSMQALGEIAVQDGGRVKPFDTLARESLELIHGKKTFDKKPAIEIVLTWLLQPMAWEEKQFFEITDFNVRKALNLDVNRKYFSPKEIMGSERLATLFQDLQARRDRKEKLDPYYSDLQRVEHQLGVFREMASGRYLRVVPAEDPNAAWISLAEMEPEFQEIFKNIAAHFVEGIAAQVENRSNLSEVSQKLTAEVQKFNAAVDAKRPGVIDRTKISTEIHYNNFRPFRWSWVFYLASSMLIGLGWASVFKHGYFLGWGATIIGMGFHIYGFAIRSYLMDRAPVTNMYETVVWVAFGVIFFAAILEAIYKWRVLLLGGAILATFSLLLSDFAPVVLNPNLDPLEPVLRDNFWLMVHVLTITVSYAPLFLSFILGDIALIYFLRGEEKHQDIIKALTLGMYRGIQIGVALLAPGIILGGIWADYSWGRFWGWDPKETWALIALLGYLAILHGRLAGYVQQFGMAVASVISFNLVIMAWYGVNFVLGAGLHSYGFGAGGVEYVFSFSAVHILFVVFVWRYREGRKSTTSKAL